MKIELDFAEFQELVAERDAMLSKIQSLESTPLEGSFEWLAQKVQRLLRGRGYTPDQIEQIGAAIKDGDIPPFRV